MDEALQDGLRWVLLTTEESWLDELDRTLAPVAHDRAQVAAVRDFLRARLDGADVTWRPRMEGMIRALDARLGPVVAGDPVPSLAIEYARLDAEVARLEAELATRLAARAAVEKKLNDAIVPGSARELKGYRFERPPPHRRLEVVNPARLPPDLMTSTPDVERVRLRQQLTGVVPPGAAWVESEPGLVVVKIGG